MDSTRRGFTIVELLIVIVVIAVLATISIVAYNGIQDRSISARRLNDMTTIAKALEMYKAQKGYYPTVMPNSSGGWERSAVNPQSFLQALKTEGILTTVPVDPINDAPQGAMGPEATFTSYTYYLYNAGQFGCDVSLGPVYVLKIEAPGKPAIAGSPGLKCGSVTVGGSGNSTPYWSGRTTN